MTKRVIFTVLGLVILVAVLGAIKGLQIRRMSAAGAAFTPPPEPVTTADVIESVWETTLTSVGSLSAVQGVTVAAELPGKVVKIDFEPGKEVAAGDLLLQQDISSEQAQLPGAEAAVKLTRINLKRARELVTKRMLPESDRDTAQANYDEAIAQADNIRAAIAKKSIRAPFGGRLGIRLVNLGEILKEGQAIVSLQSLHPIFADFSLPQDKLPSIQPGLTVRLITDGLADQSIEGKITALNPDVDPATRNFRVQATVENPDENLRPGMFVNVAVVLPQEKKVLVIPATAVLYAPYGDSVYVVEEKADEQGGAEGQVIRQQFVRLGEQRGDFTSVLEGVKAGETVVSTGVFKLRNGQAVTVDNTLAPPFKLAPKPEDN